jgi:hypothetical protein
MSTIPLCSIERLTVTFFTRREMPRSSEHAHALQFRCHRITGITANAVCRGCVQTALVEKQITDIAAQKKISQHDAAMAIWARSRLVAAH